MEDESSPTCGEGLTSKPETSTSEAGLTDSRSEVGPRSGLFRFVVGTMGF